MKGILGLLRSKVRAEQPQSDAADSTLFSTAFASQGAAGAQLVPWEARAVEVGAQRLPARRGGTLLQSLWARDKYMGLLGQEAVERMERFFTFAVVSPNRDVIRQDEYGNFMLVVLTGTVAIDRMQPWGERLRLAESRPGEILGEMSLLDGGIRFSSCTTLTDCEVAVLDAEGMDAMMSSDPQLAASLVALLARRLSQRMRVVSARLSEIQR